MSDNLFATDPSATPVPVADPNKNYLEELVGEGKKFKTPEELARGKAESDAFILRLTKEQEDLRKELNTRLTMEQYLDQLRAAPPVSQTPLPNEPNGNGGQPDASSLKAEDVERIIDQRVTAREQERIQNDNLRMVKDTLTQSLGPEFPSKLKEIGNQLGMSEQDMSDLAKLKPKALLALVERAEPVKTQQQTLFTPPQGQLTQMRQSLVDRTSSFYNDLKKKNPKEYWDPKVQNQMHQDAIRLQEKFFV